jgi:hypothetical protein
MGGIRPFYTLNHSKSKKGSGRILVGAKIGPATRDVAGATDSGIEETPIGFQTGFCFVFLFSEGWKDGRDL